MGDWHAMDLFIERTNSSHSAFAVGVALPYLGNRKDGGWTRASLDRIAMLARLDRGTVNLAIRELEQLGELEYERGRPVQPVSLSHSRRGPSRRRRPIPLPVDHWGKPYGRGALPCGKSLR